MKKIIIAISGFHGTGKSSLARELSREFNFKLISSGMVFRKIAEEKSLTLEELSRLAEESPDIDFLIDTRLKKIALKGNVIADALLSGWILKEDADIKIWLKAPLEVRIRRIANREKRSYEEVLRETISREESEKKRFKKYYGIDLNDLSVYDFVLTTYPYSYDDVKRVIFGIVKGYLKAISK